MDIQKSKSENDSAKDRKLLCTMGLVLLAVWLTIAIAPLVSLNVLSPTKRSRVDQIKDVLQQYGTIGELFGSINSLFTGGALVFALYAVILQRRDLRHQQEQINKMEDETIKQESDRVQQAMFSATFRLYDFFQKEYLLNVSKYDREFDEEQDETKKGMTVKGKMQLVESVIVQDYKCLVSEYARVMADSVVREADALRTEAEAASRLSDPEALKAICDALRTEVEALKAKGEALKAACETLKAK